MKPKIKHLALKPKTVASRASKLIAPAHALPALESVAIMLESAMHYARERNANATKRAEIAAARDVVLEMIAARQATVMHLIDRSFDEREIVLRGMMALATEARLAGDKESSQNALSVVFAIMDRDPIQKAIMAEFSS